MTLYLLKDLCLVIGLIVTALARLHWTHSLLFYTHLVASVLLATSWSLLLLLGNDSYQFLIPNVVLVLVTVVLDKLWWHWSLVHHNMVLFVALGAWISYLTLTGIDRAYFAMGFGIPYAGWLVLAAIPQITKPQLVAKEKPLVYNIDPDNDEDNASLVLPAEFLEKRLGHGFRK
jgi:hypothetical protein